MTLGEKILQARTEAGLSQRQLCGDAITRNMLSQIEHGTAKPSMATLQYLAARLGKSVSWFLEEDAVVSPNSAVMDQVRAYFDKGDWSAAMQALENYQEPDAVYDRERLLLSALLRLKLAEQAITRGRETYARELLAQSLAGTVYFGEELEQRRLTLLGQLPGTDPALLEAGLADLDEALLLRAGIALSAEDANRAERLLEAAKNRTTPHWCFLRGQAHMLQKDFSAAARCFHGAEGAYPLDTARKLEQCYRELEDYRQAYIYACKQRK